MGLICQINTTPSVIVICDIPVLMAGVATYGSPVSYQSIVRSGYQAGGGSITPVAPTANGPGAAQITLASPDIDLAGDVVLVVLDGSGNVIGKKELTVVPWDPLSGVNLGLSNLGISTNALSADILTAIGDISTVSSEVLSVPTALLDLVDAIDTGLTPRECLRLLAAALAGKIGIAGTTVTIRDTHDAKNRIVATVDGTGQRTAITYDLT
jgi:hypothetical protein